MTESHEGTNRLTGSNQIVCPKCRAHMSNSEFSRFCDQCGHRLHRKQKQRKLKKKAPGQEVLGDPDHLIKPSGAGWFWGSVELPQIRHQEISSVHDELLTSDCLAKRPFVKARTANAGRRNSDELTRPLRRISSFGQPLCLPALPSALSQRPRDELVIGRSTPKPTKPESVVGDSATPTSSCGVLWGDVLSDAIAEFESKKIILSVEIESDERCMCVLTQKLQIEEAARSKYVVASGISQLRYKQQDIEKKVRMNKEKLTMVEQRLASLYVQRDRDDSHCSTIPAERFGAPFQSDNMFSTTNQANECGKIDSVRCDKAVMNEKRIKDDNVSTSSSRSKGIDAAATLIQKRYRLVRARRLFADMVRRAYQRVFDPDTKRYFYYNARTRQSQWDMPGALMKANATMARRHPRVASPRSVNAAASRIQGLYRRRAARHAIRALLLHVYEKVYDPDSNSYYYFCSKTKTSSWEKPKLLHDEDIPIRTVHSILHAPAQSPDPSQEAAAQKIQSLYRNRATRQFVRDLTRGNIEKHFDADAQAWYYFNKRTQRSFWEHPRHAALSAVAVPR